MALPETFYALSEECSSIPPQYQWETEIENIKEAATESAESNSENVYIIYEITVRPLYRTVITVDLESF